ncbi:hypothetical protein ACVIHI_008546 [Bradyrhizobium sp. USDA 4524]|uniref:hypothetical protein n=1 Tax=unclassified Bradyrhizobium TaxID=2631580 RepID=UPI00209FE176|nr:MULTISPECIES: hypothetical protein [unclassified Bradyrhizobium]MCP1845993.1 hypothetical protein [Bradyrhizobium sp. USDA 4538]MCP1907373.1 hypothetical protein [Bradyrhizobium sp. USDA 4537]MCP1985159.1 hypothetical protein [Bradyrhizobium sp. USDA 4539]
MASTAGSNPFDLSRLSDDVRSTAAAIRRHPAFRATLRSFCSEYAGIFQGNRLLTTIATGEARQLICAFMVALHYRRDVNDPISGIVVSRVEAFARQHRLASHNRVIDLVDLMKAAGYFRSVRSMFDRRVVVLEPTDTLADLVRSFVRPFLRAFDRMNGDGSFELRLARNDIFKDAILTRALELYVDGCALCDAVPAIRLFDGRIAGYEMMLWIWTTSQSGNGSDVPVHLRYTARSFGVSDTHLRRLVQEAERQGYLRLATRHGVSLVEVRSSLSDLVELFVSLKLALFRCAIARVDTEAPPANPPLSRG